MVKRKIGISVIVPCYNEGRQLVGTIYGILNFLKKHFKNYELIMVNDGSTDDTKNILTRIMRYDYNRKHLKIVNYSKNKGKGYAIRRGLGLAKNGLAVLLDCDLSIRPVNILKTISKNKNKIKANVPFVVFGQRVQNVKQPLYRIFLGKCFRVLVIFFTGIRINDTQAPFKVLFNVNKDYISKLSIDGFAYDVELIKMLKINKIKIKLQKADYFHDENTTVTIRKVIRMGFDLIKIAFFRFKN